MRKCLFFALCLVLLAGCATVGGKKARDAQAYYEGGTAALVQGEYTDALQRLLKAVKLNPKDPYIHNNLALAYQVKKHHMEAEAHFKKAISLKANFSDALNNIGALYLKMKKYPETIKYCNMAVKDPLYRTPEKAYANMGRAYYKLKKYKDAIRYQRRAIAHDKEFCYAYTSLGQAQMKSKKFGDASKSLKKAIGFCKTYEAPYYVLGLNYLKARKQALARKQFNILIMKFPEGKYQAKAKNILKDLK